MPDVAQQLEALRFVVSTHREEFEKRRSYEWRCVLAALTFFALVIAFSGRPEAADLRNEAPAWLCWAVLLALWGVGSCFLAYTHVAHAVNKTIAHRAGAAIQRCLNGEEWLPLDLYSGLPTRPTVQGVITVGDGGFWGWLWTTIIGLILTLGAGFAVTG